MHTPITHTFALNALDALFLKYHRSLCPASHRQTFSNTKNLLYFLLQLKTNRVLFRLNLKFPETTGTWGIRYGCLCFDSLKNRIVIYGYHWVKNAPPAEFSLSNTQEICDFFLMAEASRFMFLNSYTSAHEERFREFQKLIVCSMNDPKAKNSIRRGATLYQDLKSNAKPFKPEGWKAVPPLKRTNLALAARDELELPYDMKTLNNPKPRSAKFENKMHKQILKAFQE